MDKKETIFTLLAQMNMVFRDPQVSKGTIETYVSLLSDVDINKLRVACRLYMTTQRQFPLPADLIELCSRD